MDNPIVVLACGLVCIPAIIGMSWLLYQIRTAPMIGAYYTTADVVEHVKREGGQE